MAVIYYNSFSSFNYDRFLLSVGQHFCDRCCMPIRVFMLLSYPSFIYNQKNRSFFFQKMCDCMYNVVLIVCTMSQLCLCGGCIYPHSMYAWLILSTWLILFHSMSSRNIWLSWRSANSCMFRTMHCRYWQCLRIFTVDTHTRIY